MTVLNYQKIISLLQNNRIINKKETYMDRDNVDKDYKQINEYKGDPRFIYKNKYWFWNETWSEEIGPFDTLKKCTEVFTEFCKSLDM